jgi:biofilm protein TabA
LILDSLERAGRYAPDGSRLAAGLRWLASFDPATGDGRYELDGDDLFALVQRYHTAPGAEKRFESHRRYADIQFVAAGRERILHAPVEGLREDTPYDEAADVRFFRDPPASSSLLLAAGDFAVLFPEDAHKPGCMAGGREAVLKVVVKVKL